MQTRPPTWPFTLLTLLVLGAITIVLRSDEAPSTTSSGPASPTDTPTTERLLPTQARRVPAAESTPREPVTVPTPADEPTTANLEVHVTWDDGRPLPGVRLLFTRGEELVFLGRTDTAGAFTLPAPLTAPTVLRARRGSQPLARLTVQPGAAPVELVVPLGASVEGIVRVDSSPPGEPLELALRAGQDLWPPLPNWLFSTLWQRSERWMNAGAPMPADALGHFRIAGLEAQWSGWLLAPEGFRLLPDGGALRLEGPRHDLQVELTRRPRLFGSVVTRDGQPVAGAAVDYELNERYGQGSGSETSKRSNRVTTTASGHFAIFLGPARPTGASLTISGKQAGKIGFAALEIALGRLEDYDLGEIPLDSTRSVAILVLDEPGQPIAGALVAFAAGRSEPTNARGETRLQGLPLEEVDLWADALLFERGHVTLAPETKVPVEMRLQPATGVDVQFLDAKSKPLGGLQLHVSGGEIFRGGSFEEKWAQVELGATASGGSSMDTSADGEITSEAFYPTGSTGRARIAGLLPGVPITLAARDVSSGSTTWSQTITLGPGEVRRIEAQLTDSPNRLVGRVVDGAGAPLPGANIAILHPGIENPQSFRPGEDGAFRISPLLSRTVDVWVDADGYAPTAIASHATSEPLEIVMGKGRTLRIRAVDPDGRAWPLEWAYLRWKGRMGRRGPRPPGGALRVTAARLPPGEVVARLAGHRLVAPAPAGAEEVVLSIETPGSARVTWPQDTLAGLPEGTAVLLTYRGLGALECYGWHPLTPSEREASSALLETLLPGDYALELTWRRPSGEVQSLETQMAIELGEHSEITLTP
jgi:hypothetical protein